MTCQFRLIDGLRFPSPLSRGSGRRSLGLASISLTIQIGVSGRIFAHSRHTLVMTSAGETAFIADFGDHSLAGPLSAALFWPDTASKAQLVWNRRPTEASSRTD